MWNGSALASTITDSEPTVEAVVVAVESEEADDTDHVSSSGYVAYVLDRWIDGEYSGNQPGRSIL